jgi:hypothetical protein
MALLDSIAQYFNLNSGVGRAKAIGAAPKYVFPQYLVLVLGVVVQPFLEYYMKNNAWPVDLSPLYGRAVFGIFIGIAIFPGVYKNSWDPSSPMIVQLCSIFTAGLGWQTLFATAAHLSH